MYDADEEWTDPADRSPVDWDAWEKNRLKSGYTRWWLILMAAMTIALTISFFQNYR